MAVLHMSVSFSLRGMRLVLSSVDEELLDGSGKGELVYVSLGYPVLAHGLPDTSPTPGGQTDWARTDSSEILHGYLNSVTL